MHARQRLDRSPVGFDAAREQSEKTRLAGAVRSNQPDVIALVHLERQPVKKRLSPKC